MTESLAYAAADAAIARADALTFAAVGKPRTDASFLAQWQADEEAARACRAAARFSRLAIDQRSYRAAARLFAVYAA